MRLIINWQRDVQILSRIVLATLQLLLLVVILALFLLFQIEIHAHSMNFCGFAYGLVSLHI